MGEQSHPGEVGHRTMFSQGKGRSEQLHSEEDIV